MTKDEIFDLLEDLHAVYANKMNMDNFGSTLRVWNMALSDCDAEKVKSNFIAYIRHSPFPPTPADLTKNALRKKKPNQMVIDLTKGEDWNV